MMNKTSPEQTEKKCNYKVCLLITFTIVALVNLGVFLYYDEISKEVSNQCECQIYHRL